VYDIAEHQTPLGRREADANELADMIACLRVEVTHDTIWLTVATNPDGRIERVEVFPSPIELVSQSANTYDAARRGAKSGAALGDRFSIQLSYRGNRAGLLRLTPPIGRRF
jgi:hypothetical protein